jgi:hypothetical protein
MGTLYEDLSTFMIIPKLNPLRMRHASDKICRENPNTYFMFNNLFSENQAVYEIMLKNMVQPDGPQTI